MNQASSPAVRLEPHQRQKIALRVLTKKETISGIAESEGVDARSTYCFLLEEVEQRDENTWGYYLLEAEERGLSPDYTIADGGKVSGQDRRKHGEINPVMETCGTFLSREKPYAAISLKKPKGQPRGGKSWNP